MRALVTGITGQCGSYLAELLLEKEYEVFGLVRRTSTNNLERIQHLVSNPNLKLVYGDVEDSGCINKLIAIQNFDEVYNLAAQSHVHISYDIPAATFSSVAVGPLNILEAIRNFSTDTKFYQAGSSEMYGKEIDESGYQDETTPFYPVSPYAVAKTSAFYLTRCYRESYDLFAVNAINFNNESPRRGENFVTRKITKYIANLLNNKDDYPKLELGNLDAKRDWGYSADYVRAMWLMLQQEKPDDYVIATGETYSVRDFLEIAFDIVALNWEKFVVINKKYLRPSEVPVLRGNAYKAKKQLGWQPSITFRELVELMVKEDINAIQKKSGRFS